MNYIKETLLISPLHWTVGAIGFGVVGTLTKNSIIETATTIAATCLTALDAHKLVTPIAISAFCVVSAATLFQKSKQMLKKNGTCPADEKLINITQSVSNRIFIYSSGVLLNTTLATSFKNLAFPAGTSIFPECFFYAGKYLGKLDELKQFIVPHPKKHIERFLQFGSLNYFSYTIVNASLEEFFYRGVVQSFLLKELPRFILKSINPSYAGAVDRYEAKVIRILATSILFAIAHEQFKNESGMTLALLIGDLFTSVMRENGASLFELSLKHSIYNFLASSETYYFNSEWKSGYLEKIERCKRFLVDDAGLFQKELSCLNSNENINRCIEIHNQKVYEIQKASKLGCPTTWIETMLERTDRLGVHYS